MYVATSALSANLLRGQLRYLSQIGFEVILVSSPGKELDTARECEGVQVVAVPIAREISPWRDLLSLWRLWVIMRRLRPDIANVGTPKAGLLGGIAAWLNRVPCRFYTIRGMRWETTMGFKRWLLLLCERIACRSARRLICVSESVRRKIVAHGIADANRIAVLGSGSSNGVDASRFAPTSELLRAAAALRNAWDIPAGAPVIGFVGRFTRDKGIAQLLEAYLQVRSQFPDARLLMLGDFEEGDPLPPTVRRQLKSDSQVIRPGFVPDTAPWYQLMDAVVLPTRREGFPNVVLEAHAAGKPVVATQTTGTVDAIVNGLTGLLVPVGNASALAEAVIKLLRDRTLAQAMGRAGYHRVRREFRPEIVWTALAQEYAKLLREKGMNFCPMACQPFEACVSSPSR